MNVQLDTLQAGMHPLVHSVPEASIRMSPVKEAARDVPRAAGPGRREASPSLTASQFAALAPTHPLDWCPAWSAQGIHTHWTPQRVASRSAPTALRTCSPSNLGRMIQTCAKRNAPLATTLPPACPHAPPVQLTISSHWQERDLVTSASLERRQSRQERSARTTAKPLIVTTTSANTVGFALLSSTGPSAIVPLVSPESIVRSMSTSVRQDHASTAPSARIFPRAIAASAPKDSLVSSARTRSQTAGKAFAQTGQCAKICQDRTTLSASAEMDSREKTVM